MAKSLADHILGARRRSNTQRGRFVTDDEVGGYVNDGVKALYDRVVKADNTYYQETLDFTLTGGNDVGSTVSLPNDFGRMRGLTLNPDTQNAKPVYGIAFADRNRKPGYFCDGNALTVSPYVLANRGPWRLYYTPKAPQFGPAVDVVNGDGVVASTGVWTFANGHFDQTYVNSTLVVAGTANGNDGSFLVKAATRNTLTTATTGLANETFTTGVTASVQLVGSAYAVPFTGATSSTGIVDFTGSNVFCTSVMVGGTLVVSNGAAFTGTYKITARNSNTEIVVAPAPPNGSWPTGTVAVINSPTYQAPSIATLDTTLDNYDEIPQLWAAVRIIEKKKQETDVMGALLEQAFARVDNMAAGRQSEPEAAPVLWRPNTSAFMPFGNGWSDGFGYDD